MVILEVKSLVSSFFFNSYTIGRLVSVAARPLCLFVVNNSLPKSSAENLAIAFLATAIAMAFVAADPHRKYYTSLFINSKKNIGFSFYLYATSILWLIVFGSLLVFGITVYFNKSTLFSVLVVGYFISEKVADEFLRLRLFKRELNLWGIEAAIRGLIQIILIAIFIAYIGKSISIELIVFLLALSNFIVFGPQLSKIFPRIQKLLRFKIVYRLSYGALRLLISNRILWFIALMGTAYGYLDRVFSLVIDQSLLPVLALVVMSFSVLQMSVDFYFVSPKRRDLLEGNISLISAIRSRQFLISLFSGFLASIIIVAIVIYFSVNGIDFPVANVIAIAAIQLALAITLLPYQILYWTQNYVWIFYIEILFFSAILVVSIFGHYFQIGLTDFLIIFAGIILLRALTVLYFANKSDCLRVRQILD
jgi:hypothetical protein